MNAPRPFAQTYFRGEILMQFWNTAVKGLALVNSFIILAALSVYQFGLYRLVLAAIALADNFSAGLFDDIVVTDTARGLAEGEAGAAKRLFNEFALFKVIVGGLLTVVLFFGAGRIAVHYGGDIAFFVRLASLIIVFEAAKAAEELFFTATVSFSGLATQAVLELVKLLALTAFFWAGILGIREVLIATVIASFASLLFSSYFFLREYRRHFGDVLAARGSLLLAALKRYGSAVVLRYGASRVTKNIRPWLIKFFLSTEAVAYYSLAINLITLAQGVFPINMVGRLLPGEVRDERRLRYIFVRSTKYALWLGAFMALGGFFVLPQLVALIFPKYLPAMPLFRALLLILPLYGVYKIQKSLLLALREQGILTARLVSEMFLVVGLNAALLPLIGVFGAAAEYTGTYAWRVFLFHRMLGRAHPGLRFKLGNLLRFDDDDRRLFDKFSREAASSFRRIFVRSL